MITTRVIWFAVGGQWSWSVESYGIRKNKIRIPTIPYATHCCALLIFNTQFHVKIHFYAQFTERVSTVFGPKVKRVFATVLQFTWDVDELLGVNNSKIVRHQTKITEERHPWHILYYRE